MIKNEYLIESFHKYNVFRKMAVKEKLSKENVLPEQFPILIFVYEHENTTQKEIADHLKVTPASIALSTKRLEQSKMIIKSQSGENKRCNTISLTKKGKQLVEKTKKVFEEIDNLTFKKVTAEEKEILKRVFDKMIYNLSGISNELIDKEDIFSLKQKLKNKHCK